MVFLAGVGATLALRRSMAGAMPMASAMPMAGGASLGGGAMPAPAGGGPGPAGPYLAMWVAMMMAMMTPSLVPTLSGYRRLAAGRTGVPLGAATAVVGAGYFFVWTVIGAGAWLAGSLWRAAEVRWEGLAAALAAPAAAILVVAAGGLQLTPWKLRRLARCRAPGCGRIPLPGIRGAWAHGLDTGGACALCCVGLMTIAVVAGMMDWWAMAAVAAAITIERVAPWPAAAARFAGVAAIVLGLFALGRG